MVCRGIGLEFSITRHTIVDEGAIRSARRKRDPKPTIEVWKHGSRVSLYGRLDTGLFLLLCSLRPTSESKISRFRGIG